MRLPSGVRYRAVADEDIVGLPEGRRLAAVRLGREQAELTTRGYVGHLALRLRWCERTGCDWRVAGEGTRLLQVWPKPGSKEETEG